jgi:hypothetical protein
MRYENENYEMVINIQNLTDETPETMKAFHDTDLWVMYVLRSALMWLKPSDDEALCEEDAEIVRNISEWVLCPWSDDCPHTGEWHVDEGLALWQRIHNWATQYGKTWQSGLKFVLGVTDPSVRSEILDLLRRVNPLVLDEITVVKTSRWQLFVHYDVDGERQVFPRSDWRKCSIARKHHSLRGTRGGPIHCSMDIWSNASFDDYVPVSTLFEKLYNVSTDFKVYLDFDDEEGRELLLTSRVDPVGPISHRFSKVWLSIEAMDEIFEKIERIGAAERSINPFFHPGEGLVKTGSPTVEIYLLSEWIVLEG